jgi:hypothetical protein
MSALRDAIVLHLQADNGVLALATGGIYPGLPPEADQSYPFITVTAQQAPRPERVFRGGNAVADEIVFEEALYLVKAIDQSTSPEIVGDINAAIRTALDGAVPTVTGYTAMSVQWMSDVSYDESANGQTFQHEGGIYQIWATAT